MKNILSIIIIVLLVIGIGVMVLNKTEVISIGGAGLTSTLQVATTTTVGPDLNTQLFAISDNGCRARVISTVAEPIMIIFADPTNGNLSSTTLTGIAGHTQLASTTVTYSNDNVGCGRVFGYAAASTTITISEF